MKKKILVFLVNTSVFDCVHQNKQLKNYHDHLYHFAYIINIFLSILQLKILKRKMWSQVVKIWLSSNYIKIRAEVIIKSAESSSECELKNSEDIILHRCSRIFLLGSQMVAGQTHFLHMATWFGGLYMLKKFPWIFQNHQSFC